MSHLDDARCLFIDGPVAVYLQQAAEAELLAAYERLFKVVKVAAAEMNKKPLEKMDNSVDGLRARSLPTEIAGGWVEVPNGLDAWGHPK